MLTLEDILKDLNEAQREAVTTVNGPLLIVAGAGSGKTKTLVHRLAYMVNQGIEPESILLLTFTRRSSEEMLRRAAFILDERCRNISGGTFHATAHFLLRRYAPFWGYSDQFTIVDRSDAEDIVGFLRHEKGLQKTDKRFPKKNTILDILSKSTNLQKSVGAVLEKEYPQFLEFQEDIRLLGQDYARYKTKSQVLDYDDLLVKWAELLREHPSVKASILSYYKYVMIDEYQDTNLVQSDIVQQLVGSEQNVCAVGDDAQSIYSFRGATIQNILRFPSLFPGTKVVTLEQNYRSTQPILDLSNAVISRAKEKYSKYLFTERGGTQRPVYVEFERENNQSKFVCKKILELREMGVELNQIAVLVRSGWHSNDLEVELKGHGLPFVKIGGFKFVETAHVKDVLSYLRIIQNKPDRLAWTRVLLLLEGVGPQGAQKLFQQVQDNAFVWDPLQWEKYRGKPWYLEWMKLGPLLLQSQSLKPAEWIDKILKQYKPLFKSHYDDFQKRQSDLDSIAAIAQRYNSIEHFLAEMSLDPPDGSQQDTLREFHDEGKITLSTIHSAKGLEWHSVFLISMIDGYLPSFQSLADKDDLEEERRLLYVALTRAKDNLFICKPHLEAQGGYSTPWRGGFQFSKVSRFLEEGQALQLFADKWTMISERKGPPIPDYPAKKTAEHDYVDAVWDDVGGQAQEAAPKKKYFF